ncbi:MAG TPA: protoporphyrinogen oxidase [Candidatus Acidoferrales bacterium]|nr:protoporphyrinogen oxidase [Candidatus Acidoferrales bacterium]
MTPDPQKLSAPVLVIGGGISGLACGYYLRKAGIPALVLEQSARPGGYISSLHRDGCILELGPQSFLSTDPLLEMVHDLGLDPELLPADPRAPRYVLIAAKLRAVPLAPPKLLTSSLLGLRTKWGFLREAFGHSRPPADDESIAAFVRRKFTAELLDRLAGPFVSGIYAGDPERLSLRAAFPSAHQWETQFGSVLRGASKSRPAKGARRHSLISFRRGNHTLVEGLAKSLDDALHCGAFVESISRNTAEPKQGFSVKISQAGRQTTLTASSIIVTTPADAAGRLLREISPEFDALLKPVEYAPVAVISTLYRAERIGLPLNGFGFLVPRTEGLNILGTVWNSSLFPGRAPEGFALLTSFAGGPVNPSFLDGDDATITNRIARELATILHIHGQPEHCTITRHVRALPQYNLGHSQRIAALRKLSSSFPGLFLAGNYLEGPSVGACIDLALRTGQQAREYLASCPV